MRGRGLTRGSASIVVALILWFTAFAAGFKLPITIGTAHAAPSTITQTKSGLDHFDSLTTGDTSYWYIGGDAQDYGAPHSYSEDSGGLHLSVESKSAGAWIGYYALSPNSAATAYHVGMTLPYATVPDHQFEVEMWVQSADQRWISGVSCTANVDTSGYYWSVDQGQGPNVGGGNVLIRELWTGPPNTGPLTQDCTIITNGQNYLKVYLGGTVVYKSSTLALNISSPFNSYLEVQTSSASSMRTGTFNYQYSMFGENVTVTNSPPGGTVKIVDATNTVLVSAPVSSTGTAILPVGKYRLPLTANIQVYDSTNTLVASTTSAVTIWGGDAYAVSTDSITTSLSTSLTSLSTSLTSLSTSLTSVTSVTSLTSVTSVTSLSTSLTSVTSLSTSLTSVTSLSTSLTSVTSLSTSVTSLSTSATSLTTTATTTSTTASTGGIALSGVQSTSATVSSPPYQITLGNFNVGTGGNRLLLVGVSANNQYATSVTFGGVPLTEAVFSFYNDDAEFWYLLNPTGTANIVVTMAGSTSAVVGAYAFSGVDQTNPIPTTATNLATTASSPTVSITTKYPSSWVVDLPSIWGGVTLGSATCTQRWDVNVPGAVTGASSSATISLPRTATCSWTASGGGDLWDDVAIEVKAA